MSTAKLRWRLLRPGVMIAYSVILISISCGPESKPGPEEPGAMVAGTGEKPVVPDGEPETPAGATSGMGDVDEGGSVVAVAGPPEKVPGEGRCDAYDPEEVLYVLDTVTPINHHGSTYFGTGYYDISEYLALVPFDETAWFRPGLEHEATRRGRVIEVDGAHTVLDLRSLPPDRAVALISTQDADTLSVRVGLPLLCDEEVNRAIQESGACRIGLDLTYNASSPCGLEEAIHDLNMAAVHLRLQEPADSLIRYIIGIENLRELHLEGSKITGEDSIGWGQTIDVPTEFITGLETLVIKHTEMREDTLGMLLKNNSGLRVLRLYAWGKPLSIASPLNWGIDLGHLVAAELDGVQVFLGDSQLPELRVLQATSSTYPISGIWEAIDSSRLEVLVLDITTLPEASGHFDDLPALRALVLEAVTVETGMFEWMASQTSLEHVDLSKAKIDPADLAALGSMASLKHLDLTGTKVKDKHLASLASLQNLQVLRLEKTKVKGKGLAHLAPLASLRVLDLRDTAVNDSAMAAVGSLASLEEIDLEGTKVGDAGMAGLAGLPSLEVLVLSGTKVMDAGLAHLAGAKHLQMLDLEGTQVSGSGLAALSGLGDLRWLELQNSAVTDAGMAGLAGLTSLEVLVLTGTPVSDAGLDHLSGLTALRVLDLGGTAITGPGLVHFEGLQDLDLSDTAVNGASMAHLTKMAALFLLDLDQTKMDDGGCGYIASLSSLSVLLLGDTSISDGCALKLHLLSSLIVVDLSSTNVSGGSDFALREQTGAKVVHW